MSYYKIPVSSVDVCHCSFLISAKATFPPNANSVTSLIVNATNKSYKNYQIAIKLEKIAGIIFFNFMLIEQILMYAEFNFAGVGMNC